jgi:hypothetical protein
LSRELEKNELHVSSGYFAGVRVLMMMGAPEQAEIADAFRLGVRGVVTKTPSPPVWFKSIRRIVAGEYSVGRKGEFNIVERVARGWSKKNLGVSSRFANELLNIT